MRPLFLPLIGGFLTLIGCVNPNAPIETSAGKLTQEQVDAIVEKCGGSRGMATISQGKMVIYRATDISITGCVLEALQATGETTLTSVGNERHDRSNRHSSTRRAR